MFFSFPQFSHKPKRGKGFSWFWNCSLSFHSIYPLFGYQENKITNLKLPVQPTNLTFQISQIIKNRNDSLFTHFSRKKKSINKIKQWKNGRLYNNSINTSTPSSAQHCCKIRHVALLAIVDSLEHVICQRLNLQIEKHKQNREAYGPPCVRRNAWPVKLTAMSIGFHKKFTKKKKMKLVSERGEIIEQEWHSFTCLSSVQLPWLNLQLG